MPNTKDKAIFVGRDPLLIKVKRQHTEHLYKNHRCHNCGRTEPYSQRRK